MLSIGSFEDTMSAGLLFGPGVFLIRSSGVYLITYRLLLHFKGFFDTTLLHSLLLLDFDCTEQADLVPKYPDYDGFSL